MMSDPYLAIDAPGIRSLCWAGDVLIDWVGGGKTLHLDGMTKGACVIYSYRFDAAVSSPCGDYVVIYEKLGTKGLVLFRGKVLREINRSFYHAHVYEYPVAIIQTRAGRILLAHCPEDYCRLDLEDIETGQRLTNSEERAPSDYFHSRLRASPDGKWLISAGWFWHPWESLQLFNLEAVLKEPSLLDHSAPLPDIDGELAAAEFLPNNHIVVATSDDTMNDDETKAYSIGPNSIAVFNPISCEIISCVTASEPVGSLMPIDMDIAIGFYGHPKLYSLKTGEVLKRWDNIHSGNQMGSIIGKNAAVPSIACDAENRRFAIAGTTAVEVVTLSNDLY